MQAEQLTGRLRDWQNFWGRQGSTACAQKDEGHPSQTGTWSHHAYPGRRGHADGAVDHHASGEPVLAGWRG
eukprot:8974758-Alexandrium_andersonii.AAC.1